MIDIRIDANGGVHVNFLSGGPDAHFYAGVIRKHSNGCAYYGSPHDSFTYLTSLQSTPEAAAKALAQRFTTLTVRETHSMYGG